MSAAERTERFIGSLLVAMREPRGKLAPGAVAALPRTQVKDRRMKARATSKRSGAGLNPNPESRSSTLATRIRHIRGKTTVVFHGYRDRRDNDRALEEAKARVRVYPKCQPGCCR